MKRSEDRILTSHVGSLIRPEALRMIMAARERGMAYDERDLAATLSAAVSGVVGKQTNIGLDVISDGEYGKTGWNRYVAERMEGFIQRQLRAGERARSNFDQSGEAKKFADFYTAYSIIQEFDWEDATFPASNGKADAKPARLIWECTGPISYKHGVVQRDIATFKAALKATNAHTGFLPVASPLSARGLWLNSYYKTEEEVAEALSEALRQEYKAIVDAGLLLQIDDPFIADQYERLVAEKGEKDALRYLEERVELLNHALRDIPEENIRFHVCWGSWNGPHTFDVPLKKIVNLILKVKAQAYSLEAGNPRHEHEWLIWKDVKLPAGKILIPGVVSHVTNVVEHPELVAWRIANFASVIGRENIIASTDCGFSQSYNHMRVHSSIQWAKLEALVEGAIIASRQLWS